MMALPDAGAAAPGSYACVRRNDKSINDWPRPNRCH